MAPDPASGGAAFWRVCGVGTGLVGSSAAERSNLAPASASGPVLFARLSLCGSCLAGGGGAPIALAACCGARYWSGFALASESDSLFLAVPSTSGTGLAAGGGGKGAGRPTTLPSVTDLSASLVTALLSRDCGSRSSWRTSPEAEGAAGEDGTLESTDSTCRDMSSRSVGAGCSLLGKGA